MKRRFLPICLIRVIRGCFSQGQELPGRFGFDVRGCSDELPTPASGTGFTGAKPNPVNPVESLFPTTLSEARNAFLANNPILLVQDNDPRLMEDGFFWRVMRKIHDRDAIADRAEVSCGAV